MSAVLDMGDGRQLLLDEYGHLQNRTDWSRAVADRMSELDGIELEAGHWHVIDIMHEYYDEAGIEPPMRILCARLKGRGAGAIANSLELYRLFPEGPVRQASRYGGLPIPVSCI